MSLLAAPRPRYSEIQRDTARLKGRSSSNRGHPVSISARARALRGCAGDALDALDGCELLGGVSNNVTASFKFPSALLRLSASDGGLTDPTKAYFGFRTSRTATSNNSDPSVADLHRLIYSGFPDDPTSGDNAAGYGVTEYSHVFSLDDIRKSPKLSVAGISDAQQE